MRPSPEPSRRLACQSIAAPEHGRRGDEEAMGVTKEDVEAAITSALGPSHLVVTDTSGGCGASYEIDVVSQQFEGKRLLERHRMVNTALAPHMAQIHAVSIKKALTPAQAQPQPEPAADEAQA